MVSPWFFLSLGFPVGSKRARNCNHQAIHRLMCKSFPEEVFFKKRMEKSWAHLISTSKTARSNTSTGTSRPFVALTVLVAVAVLVHMAAYGKMIQNLFHTQLHYFLASDSSLKISPGLQILSVLSQRKEGGSMQSSSVSQPGGGVGSSGCGSGWPPEKNFASLD